MQTFLPYRFFDETAKCLDYRRLGKQRVECMQILKALKKGGAWANHPSTLMWKGYEECLKVYMNEIITQWVSRGYKNTMELNDINIKELRLPPWLGGPIHSTHRAALLFKNFEFYKQYNWEEEPKIEYFWPSKC